MIQKWLFQMAYLKILKNLLFKVQLLSGFLIPHYITD